MSRALRRSRRPRAPRTSRAARQRSGSAGTAYSEHSSALPRGGRAQPLHQRQEVAEIPGDLGGKIAGRTSLEIDLDHAEEIPELDRLDMRRVGGKSFGPPRERVLGGEPIVGSPKAWAPQKLRRRPGLCRDAR